jgi:hypothetical protein
LAEEKTNMSWDVMVFNFGEKPPVSPAAMKETDVQPLGPADQVRSHLARLLPGLDWSDPSWGLYRSKDFCIEFNTGEVDSIGHMMLHVHGGGDPITAIMAFTRALGWWALDCSTMKYLDPEQPSQAGWEAFQRFCRGVVKDDPS